MADAEQLAQTQRILLADALEALPPTWWSRPTLLPDWSAHALLAHVVEGPRASALRILLDLVRAGGSLDRAALAGARRVAAGSPPAVLLQRLRAEAGRRPVLRMVQPEDWLTEVAVHALDLMRPRRATFELVPEAAEVTLAHVLQTPYFGAVDRVGGLTLRTPTGVLLGDGPAEVGGPIDDLLLVAVGRPAGLATLEGPGAQVLRRRLAPEQPS